MPLPSSTLPLSYKLVQFSHFHYRVSINALLFPLLRYHRLSSLYCWRVKVTNYRSCEQAQLQSHARDTKSDSASEAIRRGGDQWIGLRRSRVAASPRAYFSNVSVLASELPHRAHITATALARYYY